MRRRNDRPIDPLLRPAERANEKAGALTAREVRQTGHDLPRAVDQRPDIEDMSVWDSLPATEQRWYKKIVVIRGGAGVADAAWQLLKDSANALTWVQLAAGGGAAPAPNSATYITQTANGSLTAEQALGALATGILKSTTTTGVVSIATFADLNSWLVLAADVDTGGGTNTSTVTWAGIMAATFAVTNGTYDILVRWSVSAWHSAAATLKGRPVVESVAGASMFQFMQTATQRQTLAGAHLFTGVVIADGSVAYDLEILSDTAGTLTANYGAMSFVCRRTA